MKLLLLLAGFLFFVPLNAQDDQPRPAYCDDLPVAMEARALPPSEAKPDALPRFPTTSLTEYKIQVAILRNTDPRAYPFHPLLVARYRPCEEVWVVESKATYRTREEAESARAELVRLGYSGAYLTTLVAYE